MEIALFVLRYLRTNGGLSLFRLFFASWHIENAAVRPEVSKDNSLNPHHPPQKDCTVAFWVYILHCADHSYYTGHTDNLEKRIGQHETGELGGYTHNRRPVTLAFSQVFTTREEALVSERQIKGWNRAKKEALINGDWKRVQQLAWGTRNQLPEHLR